MKITDITTKVMNASQFSNWIFVFAHTDEGIVGYGEATLDGCEVQVVNTINEMKHFYIGSDPLKEKPALPDLKGGMIAAAALSGIDMALWDIRGKYVNQPVYALLGGAARTELDVYATFNRTLIKREIKEFTDTAEKIVEDGYKGLKCAPFDGYNYNDYLGNADSLNRGFRRIEAIRKAVGDDIKLHVDNHWRFDYHTAICVTDKIKEYGIYWFEAPISEKYPAEMARLRSRIDMPMAGCEMQTSVDEVKELLINDALDVYMFDIKYIGGITGFLKANALAEGFGKLTAPHNMTGPVSNAASMHISSVIGNFLTLENHVKESEWSDKVSNLDKSVIEGKMKVPTGAGLGIELDMELIERNEYKRPVYLRDNMLGG